MTRAKVRSDKKLEDTRQNRGRRKTTIHFGDVMIWRKSGCAESHHAPAHPFIHSLKSLRVVVRAWLAFAAFP